MLARVFFIDIARASLLTALLFLSGELLKYLGLGRHLIPTALAPAGVMLATGFCLIDGMPLAQALTQGVPNGVIGAAICVYLHQLVVQAGRADCRQAPFKGFHFNKKGEGM